MEKIKLANDQVFNSAPMGVVGNDITKRRRITFTSDLGYADIETMLSSPDNISRITYMLETGAIIGIYTDCVALKSLTKDMDVGTYVAEFSTDATEKKLQDLQAKVDLMQLTIDTLTAREEVPIEPEPEIIPEETEPDIVPSEPEPEVIPEDDTSNQEP